MQYHFDFAPIWANRDLILDGLLTTMALSALGLILALIVGVIVGTAGAAQSRALRIAAATYVEVMRNIPLLVHMYAWYVGLAFLRLPPFWCATAALTLYSGAYVAETIRAGLGAVPRGQNLAALATGLTRLQALRLVIYPQALRIVTPSLASLASQLIKDSSLASVITVAELTYEASAIEGQTFRTFEVYITISALYLALVTLVTFGLMLIPGARAQGVQGFGDA
ncbi:MAG TPA: amino acid ABC transporter permease [Xanthobacteraceae bacterium]|nr:amino acid ABC transporter permease [Xanthobacteraceae bacterium]